MNDRREGPFADVPSVPDATVPASLDLEYGDLRLEPGAVLGYGGNGTVHEVTTPSGRRAALKRPHVAKGENREQFLEEAEMWSHLTHRYIVRVYGTGVDPEPWIAMELADEGTLADRIGRMRVDEALWTSAAVAEAVRYAHERGVMHYDLKPENVLLCSSPEGTWSVPKVTDWGLSELLLTKDESQKGMTYPYAAPEQFGDAGDVGRPADVYQLGATVYALLTGQPPVSGSQWEIAERAKEGDWAPPTALNPALPPEADRVLGKALATDPAARYEDVLLFKQALETLFRDAYVTASATHPGVTPRRTGVVQADGPGTAPDERWRTALAGKPVDTPVVANGRVYVVTTDGTVSMHELTSGAAVASVTLPDRPLAGPELVGDELCVLTDGPALARLDANSLDPVTVLEPSFTPRSTLGCREDRLYFTTTDRELVAVEDERTEWVAPLPGNPDGLVAASTDAVMVSTFRGTTCLDATDGAPRWTFDVGAPHRATPVITSGAAVVGGTDMAAELDLRGGEPRWRVSTPGVVTGAAVVDETAYLGTAAGSLLAVAREDGAVRWETSLKGRAVGAPVVAGETVYVACTGQNGRSLSPRMDGVLGVDAAGRRQWAVAPGADVVGAPVPVDRLVVFGTVAGDLVAVR